MAESAQGHLVNHLRDAHALEVHAARQLARAADHPHAGDAQSIYKEHLEQTREHEEAIRRLLDERGHESSAVEDKTLRAGVIGFRQLADIAPDTPVNLAMHFFGLTHLEIATYELLAQIAERAQDEDAAGAAEHILADERDALEKVADTFDAACKEVVERDENGDGVLKFLQDVHALEQQALQMLGTIVEDICEDEELKKVYRDQLEQTEEHARTINERIEAHDAKPSAIKDLHMSTAKSALHDLAGGPPDTAVKLAMNVICLDGLQVAAYECLCRIADAAGDGETVEAAKGILNQEREAVEGIRGIFERSVELMLEGDPSYDEARSAEMPQEA